MYWATLMFDAVCVGLNAVFIWNVDSALNGVCESIRQLSGTLGSCANNSSDAIPTIKRRMANMHASVSWCRDCLFMSSLLMFNTQITCLGMMAFKYMQIPGVIVPGSETMYSWWIRSSSVCLYACASFGMLFRFRNILHNVQVHWVNSSLLTSLGPMLEIAMPFAKAALYSFGKNEADGSNRVNEAARSFVDFVSLSAAIETDEEEWTSDEDGSEVADISPGGTGLDDENDESDEKKNS